MEHSVKKERLTFTDQMRLRFKAILEPIAVFFNRLGVYPNTMTLIGLIGNTLGAVFLAQGRMTLGGILIWAMGPIDALDGTMARLRGEPSRYGAFVDSVTDRYSELVIFGGLLIYFLEQGNWLGGALTYAAASGSILTSYIRARAQSLGYEAKVGVITRLERYLILAPALMIQQPFLGVAILALGANISAVQRLIYVRRMAMKGSAPQNVV